MTTFTLNRNFDTNDFMFAALNNRSYADLKASMESQRVDVITGSSISEKIKRFFFGK